MNDFVTMTSNDWWFNKYPEKIAGTPFKTTSLYFPIMVKGNKQDVLRVTGMLSDSKEKHIRVLKAKAIAVLLKLKYYESV